MSAGLGDRIQGWTVAAIPADLVLLRDPIPGRTMRLITERQRNDARVPRPYIGRELPIGCP